MNSYFELLRTRNILEILDGDASFGEIKTNISQNSITISLPYLSGPNICDISTQFGLPVTYSWHGGAKSRWEYLNDLIEYCINNHKESELFSFLFSKSQFIKKLNGCTSEEIDSTHQIIVEEIISIINGALKTSGYELLKTGDRVVIQKIGKEIVIPSTSLKQIGHKYISELLERAMKDIAEKNFDSAITKARTLLEEVFCYVIERKKETPTDSGDIGKLFNQVKTLYNMHQNKDIDKRINNLLSGLEKILSSIVEMRNKGSDSHGVGTKRIRIGEHHTRLFVNSAIMMADFVFSVSEKQLS